MIITINIGTSSIKTALYEHTQDTVRRINTQTSSEIGSPESIQKVIISLIDQSKNAGSEVSALGIRVVHGGERFTTPVIVTPEVITYLHSVESLAPLHNPPVVKAIEFLLKEFPTIPTVAVFDTTFHTSMPKKSKYYAVPPQWSETYGVLRYGFHGLAHQNMLTSYISATGTPLEKTSLITAQLGSGCSVCAIKEGRSFDTSMGFSPLEGIISRTRSGDIDPAVLPYLSEKLNKTVDEILFDLNHHSGLAGVSETDGDIRSVVSQVNSEDSAATFALEQFIYRIQKYLGAYDAILNGAQGFVFGGGISEHNIDIIEGIFSNPYFGISINREEFKPDKEFHCISSKSSTRPVFIAHVSEEYEIAKATIDALTK